VLERHLCFVVKPYVIDVMCDCCQQDCSCSMHIIGVWYVRAAQRMEQLAWRLWRHRNAGS
jgi:hypothetical protein